MGGIGTEGSDIERSGVQISAGPIAGDFQSPPCCQSSSPVSPREEEWDIYDTKEQLGKWIQEVPSWNTAERNKQRILDFLARTRLEGIGVVQRSKYVCALKILLKAVNKDFDDFTPKDLESFMLSMMGYGPKTRKTRWYDAKKFFRYIGKEDLFKGTLRPVVPKGMKLPEQLLTEEEVTLLVSATSNIRDKALISVLYDSGCRIGELLTRRIRNVIFDDYGAVLTVDGKTGMRRVRLVRSVPLLANWVANHPQNRDSDAFLWIGERSSTRPIRYRTAARLVKELAERAGIKKHVHPHLFRHSRATHMANKLTEQQLKVYFGWTGDSKMLSTYIHLSGRDVDDAILQINGIKTSDSERQKPQIRYCARCGNKNDLSALYCSKCGMVLSEREVFGLFGDSLIRSLPTAVDTTSKNNEKNESRTNELTELLEDKGFLEFMNNLYAQWRCKQ